MADISANITPSVILAWDKDSHTFQFEPSENLWKLGHQNVERVLNKCIDRSIDLAETGESAPALHSFIEQLRATVKTQRDTAVDFEVPQIGATDHANSIRLTVRHIDDSELSQTQADQQAFSNPSKLCVGMIQGGESHRSSAQSEDGVEHVAYLTSLVVPKEQKLSSEIGDTKFFQESTHAAAKKMAHMLRTVDATLGRNHSARLLTAWRESLKDQKIKSTIHELSWDSAVCQWEACLRQSKLAADRSMVYKTMGRGSGDASGESELAAPPLDFD